MEQQRPFTEAHAEFIWKNKYETRTDNSISFSWRAYYVCALFVLKCSEDRWLLMKRTAGQLAADIPDARWEMIRNIITQLSKSEF